MAGTIQELTTAIQLNTDFGHSPVGHLGARSVRQGVAGAGIAEKKSTFIGRAIRNLAMRTARLFSGREVQPKVKFRSALNDTSAFLGDVLGALSKTGKHGVDGKAAAKAVQDMEGALKQMAAFGAPKAEVLDARINLNLRLMSKEQLLALREGVAQAQAGSAPVDKTVKAYLPKIHDAVEQEILDRMVHEMRTNMAQDPLSPKKMFVKETIEKAGTEVEVAASAQQLAGWLDAIKAKADVVLDAYGPTSGRNGNASGIDRDTQRNALIKAVLTDIVQSGKSTEILGTELKYMGLPRDVLFGLLNSPSLVPRGPDKGDGKVDGKTGGKADGVVDGVIDRVITVEATTPKSTKAERDKRMLDALCADGALTTMMQTTPADSKKVNEWFDAMEIKARTVMNDFGMTPDNMLDRQYDAQCHRLLRAAIVRLLESKKDVNVLETELGYLPGRALGHLLDYTDSVEEHTAAKALDDILNRWQNRPEIRLDV